MKIPNSKPSHIYRNLYFFTHHRKLNADRSTKVTFKMCIYNYGVTTQISHAKVNLLIGYHHQIKCFAGPFCCYSSVFVNRTNYPK